MLSKFALSTVASLALASAVQAAPISISGSGSTGVSFSGTVDYNQSTSILTIVLTNTSSGNVTDSSLTAYAFNIEGNDYLEKADSPFQSGWSSLTSSSNIGDEEDASPYGSFDAAAGVGSKFLNGSGSDSDALQNGETGTWAWLIEHKNSGDGAGANLDSDSFVSEESNGGQDATFLVRFKGIEINGSGDGSDKVVGAPGAPTPIPLPAAAWMGLALMGGLGIARLRRRRHD